MAAKKKKVKSIPLEKLLYEHFGKKILKATDKTSNSKTPDFMLINTDGFELYHATKKVSGDEEVLDTVKLIKSYKWIDFESVKIDKFALSTLYVFNTGLKLQVDAFDDLTKSLQANGIETTFLERKWFNKILGFRSKKKWKMAIATIGYLFIFFTAIDAFNESDAEKEEKAVAQAQQEQKAEEATAKAKAEKEAADKIKAEKEAKAAEDKAKAEAEVLAKAKEERARKEAAMKLSGSGDSVTKKFELDAGFVIFDFSYNGGSNFAVKLLNESGDTVELLVNTIGSYKGKTIALVPSAGNYLLNVTSQGAWTAQGSQAIGDNTEEGSISGTGDDVRFVKIEKGLRTFSFDYKGQGNFAVHANKSVLLANEIGNYQGSTAQKVEDTAVYIISVISEGNWTINIE